MFLNVKQTPKRSICMLLYVRLSIQLQFEREREEELNMSMNVFNFVGAFLRWRDQLKSFILFLFSYICVFWSLCVSLCVCACLVVGYVSLCIDLYDCSFGSVCCSFACEV